jgi:hypothetical protein
VNQKLARFTSILFHPIFLPVFAILLITQFHFIIVVKLNAQPKLLFLMAYMVSLTLIPLTGVMMMLRKYKLSELSELTQQERVISAGVLALVYLFVAFTFTDFFVDKFLRVFVLSLAISCGIMAVVNQFFKLSFHAFGWGGLLAMVWFLGKMANTDLTLVLILVLLLSGWVGSARLYVKAHQPKEVYLGFLLGILSNYTVFQMYYQYGF